MQTVRVLAESRVQGVYYAGGDFGNGTRLSDHFPPPLRQ